MRILSAAPEPGDVRLLPGMAYADFAAGMQAGGRGVRVDEPCALAAWTQGMAARGAS